MYNTFKHQNHREISKGVLQQVSVEAKSQNMNVALRLELEYITAHQESNVSCAVTSSSRKLK